jgi:hypothetical protein
VNRERNRNRGNRQWPPASASSARHVADGVRKGSRRANIFRLPPKRGPARGHSGSAGSCQQRTHTYRRSSQAILQPRCIAAIVGYDVARERRECLNAEIDRVRPYARFPDAIPLCQSGVNACRKGSLPTRCLQAVHPRNARSGPCAQLSATEHTSPQFALPGCIAAQPPVNGLAGAE